MMLREADHTGAASGSSGEDHDFSVGAAAISLPKGGGAIRGIGEKFASNPVTGTASMSVPLATSPGRSGFGPQLSLSYDSGSGNGPFGFGWSLSLPAIMRKSDKGLPQYRDAEETDVYILAGAEDLVPVLLPDGTRFKDDTSAPGYVIHRYRPRIEGLFARIERWTKLATGEMHWRSITRDNVTTLYGRDNGSRIADPADPSPASPARIFSWLICQSYDDKGNAVIYAYAAENDENINRGAANERNRMRSANRYLKRIKYGNRTPNRDLATWNVTDPAELPDETWMFEVVFDYDEGHYEDVDLDPARPEAAQHRFVRASASPELPWNAQQRHWAARPDPFSFHRGGFELRTYRRCRHVLMFHHIPALATGEKGYEGLMRSTEFDYADLDFSQPVAIADELAHQGSTRFASFIRAITQSGYVRDDAQPVVVRNGVQFATYLKKSLPPLELEYSKAAIQDQARELDAASLQNLPAGLDEPTYRWVDLDGEGISGILTEQAGAWFYKPNMGEGRFGPLETVGAKPSLANLGGSQQLVDIKGDGQLDLVMLAGATRGFYERTLDQDWAPFRSFRQLPDIAWDEPNLRFVDLDGDGHSDVLITEQDALTWYPSLADLGFGPARSVRQPSDEERGPRLVFADGTQSIYLADMCGDGLTDLVRVRNGEVCYWPNLGYGRFGPKVTMDNAPWLDRPDQFDQRRVRLADIDGSGTSDIIYLADDGVRLYFNQSGNRLSEARRLAQVPGVDGVSSIVTADLLGNGTACLVWSSPLPAHARRPLRYVDLMGGTKPHLLVKTANNLGAETEVQYAPSTKFYLADKRDGRPWLTRLPFPVHVVERVVTYDRISGNRFVSEYAYHHGHFDGVEREFRGFGMVEQRDTEQFAALDADGQVPAGTNVESGSHVPPVLTKTWFHTGLYLGRQHVSDFFAGLLDAKDVGDYYREPGWTDAQARAHLLDDSVLPDHQTIDDEREACRALKGSMLRQEVYALDGTDKQQRPYTVTEHNFAVRVLQPRRGNRHGVFFTHPRESLSRHYERTLVPLLNGAIVDQATASASPAVEWLADPRVAHSITLQVDDFGNVLSSASIGYGRRYGDLRLPSQYDRDQQTKLLATCLESRVTKWHGTGKDEIDAADDYRTPLPYESRRFELTGMLLASGRDRFTFEDVLSAVTTASPLDYEQAPTAGHLQKRLIEHVRSYFRRNDLDGALPLGELEPLGLPSEAYQLAFTPGLLAQAFERNGQALLPNPADALGGGGAGGGGYVDLDADGHWWIPSGRAYLSPESTDTAANELAHARRHFFLPHRYRDPFHTDTSSTESFISYDGYDLLTLETRDALGNRVTTGERKLDGNLDPTKPGNDYRTLQPRLLSDPNRNRSVAAFDALGMVVGTAVMGKPEESLGDSLDGFIADLTEAEILDHLAAPLAAPHAILGSATTRLVHDLSAFQRSKTQASPQPAVVYTLARETHVADLAPGGQTKIRHSFSYSDGFSREIQKKSQAEPGPTPQHDASGRIIVGTDGQPLMSASDTAPRWVGSGWTVFNNKGKPVRQYEPFFTDIHRFELDVRIGVSPVLFYDPVGRVIATLHPNHAWEKAIVEPWQQDSWDVNDTVLVTDPKTDADVGDFFRRLPDADYLPTWHALRTDPTLAGEASQRWPDPKTRDAEKRAAEDVAAHADTPGTACFDTLGRPVLSLADNGPDPADPSRQLRFPTRIALDIQGNRQLARDAVLEFRDQQGDVHSDELGRVIARYAYDMLGNCIRQLSMEAGARWTLNHATGKAIRAWDDRGHRFRTEYDPLRRPLRAFVAGADPANPGQELLTGRLVYGEQHPQAEARNLRGRLHLSLDQAGALTSEAHDFKGNPVLATRRLTSGTQYRQAVDWLVVDADHVALPSNATATLDAAALDAVLAPRLEPDTYASSIIYDALKRPVTLTTPHTPAMPPNVVRPGYNDAGLLERIDAVLRGAAAGGQPAWTPFVANIDYDAKGQRRRIDYANGASTFCDYDPFTFRLVQLLTRRSSVAFPDDCPQPFPPGWPGCQVQNLHYTYDPAGNIADIRDDAQQTIYFRNKRVEPNAHYIYDPIYRLIEASGREHLGQVGGTPIPHSYNDAPRVGVDWSANDGNAMGTYVERYVYDAVGNFREMQHRGADPASPGWTRAYAYNEASLTEPGKQSNRLSSTALGNNNPVTEPYAYDPHGNMLRMPHLQIMQWDFKDQLQMTQRQAVNAADADGMQHQGERTYYVYDSGGQRVRKVTELATGQVKDERIYLGGFELYRESGANPLVRETLHIMDDKQRVALVETRTQGSDASPAQLIRYQLGNHVGSASLELDDRAQVISYEEYTPFGSSSYQAVRSQTETPKRYRYTGRERDEESGLSYHRARYYAPWLGRWTSADPAAIAAGRDRDRGDTSASGGAAVSGKRARRSAAGPGDSAASGTTRSYRDPIDMADGPNLYAYVRNSPIGQNDTTGWKADTPPEVAPDRGAAKQAEIAKQGKSDTWWGGVLQSLSALLSFSASILVGALIGGPVGAAIGAAVGFGHAAISAVGQDPATRHSETYKNVLGISSWLNPFTLAALALWTVFVGVPNLVMMTVTLGLWDRANFSLSFYHGMLVMNGGLIRPARAGTIGNVIQLNPHDPGVAEPETREGILRHEWGHSLNNAMFGLFQIEDPIIEKFVGQESSLFERLAESNVNPYKYFGDEDKPENQRRDKDSRRLEGGRGFGSVPWWNP
jgi:RHS repeat-associated protein